MGNSIKIIIVDDHPLIREGIKQILSFSEDVSIVGEGCNGQEALSLVKQVPCDLLLLDINMPVLDGIGALRALKETHPTLKVLLLSVASDLSTFKEALALQVNGYILKDSAGTTLIDAIKHIHTGNVFIDQSLNKHVFHLVQESSSNGSIASEPSPTPDTSPLLTPYTLSINELSDRQKAILYLISRGLSNKEIASQLFLSEKTIRNNITLLFKKINVKDRVQATQFVLNYGKKIV